ncbi:hypothetical protein EXS71_04790 [Candidatus Uhrbacteria bacterium]|nr:hypothetical protein [Candidatus Uhrbacteria bacterium]
MNNAYILERTMNDYAELKQALEQGGFTYQKEEADEDVTVTVPADQVGEFATVVQKHLNAPYNYVDVKFPNEKTTAIIFADRIYRINNPVIDEEAKVWAISIGLPKEQADWPTFYDQA